MTPPLDHLPGDGRKVVLNPSFPRPPFSLSAACIAFWFLSNGALVVTNKYLVSTGFKEKRYA